ncbi:MAG: DUF4412 domain-containing protein [Bacteroidetes bacterium]|nr:DUF4412 domain-containing protein [Bacteroidota bacterium]
MKKLLTLTLSFLTVFTVLGQTFEGKIFYTNSFKSKNSKMTDQQWTAMMGSKLEYMIKGGDYKTISNGTVFQWQLYINKVNKLYNKMSTSAAALWNDAAVQGDEVLKIKVNRGVTKVLGYMCDEVILTCKSGVQKYYFNSKWSVNTKLFIKHKFGNWYDFISKSNSLPLKSIIETAQYTMVSVATDIKPMKLDAKIFELPKGMKTEKSQY